MSLRVWDGSRRPRHNPIKELYYGRRSTGKTDSDRTKGRDQEGRVQPGDGTRGGRQSGDGATIRVVEEGGKRIAKSFRIRAKDPNAAKADAMLIDLKDSHWLNRKYAAEVLGELKDPRAVVPLVEALSDEVGDVRQRAYDSLIKIGGSAVSSLVPLLVSEEDDVRQSATEIIRKIGKPAVEPLATALAEADDRLKTRIMKVLDRMGYKPKAKEGAQAEPAKLLS